MTKKRILFISQEIFPFLPKNDLSSSSKRLSQGLQENGKEIRVFMPRYGSINERRHQLHEVIRLSGMNIVIDDHDHQLIIKVASIPSAKLQVYFIDNEEYFKRKHVVTNDQGEYFEDNDERAIFFCKGVLETVKKLGWQPDVIMCQGWLGMFMPLYIKNIFDKDPHFTNTKIILSLCNSDFNKKFDPRLIEKLRFDGFSKEVLKGLEEASFENILRKAVKFSDGIAVLSEELNDVCKKIYDEADCLKLEYKPEEHQNKEMSEFIDKVLEVEELVE